MSNKVGDIDEEKPYVYFKQRVVVTKVCTRRATLKGRVIKLSRDLVYTFSCLLEINGDSRASG
uniref:Uncharacterized protein n=1 Tax=Magallana gigas TaxID=29159 RepID=K1QHS3_MAGGI